MDSYEKLYSDLPFEDKLRNYRYDDILNFLKNVKCENMLEIGCGDQPFFEHYATPTKYVVCEPGGVFHDAAKLKAVDRPEIDFYLGNFEDFAPEFKKNEFSFDVILIGGFLHEIDNPQEILNLIKQICTQNTIVITYVPNAKSFHRLLAYESGLINSIYEFSANDLLFERRVVFDRDSISELIEKCGFEIMDLHTYYIKVFTHNQLVKMVKSEIIDLKIMEGFSKVIKHFPDFGCEIFVAFKLNAKN
jgi:SAM-dependent methyltransferase